MRLSAIQLCSVPNVDENLTQIEHHIESLTTQHNNDDEHVVVLPESCLYFGGKDKEQLSLIQPDKQAYIKNAFKQLAMKYGIYLVAGTVPHACDVAEKFTASSFVFSPQGQMLAEYQKMHLFDVYVEDNSGSYLESKYTQPGKEPVVSQLSNINLGQSVCYDIRFPELYRCMTNLGANVITVPAAFTKVTGDAHWETLLRARAIENQVYVVAAAQEGVHQNGRETWGHSMIIDPWGNKLAELSTGQGWISAVISLTELNQIRKNIPTREHNRFDVTKKP